MSAVINPRPNSTGTNSSIGQDAKPILLHKIDGHVARVNDVILLSKEEGVWTASDDRSIRLYLKRDNGQFWPSIHRIMPIAATCIFYSEETTRLLVGLLNGHVYEYIVADDYNSMNDPESRKWSIHAGPVSGLGLALDAELVFSCSKDKSVVWHCSETGVKRGAFHCENSCTSLIIDLPFVFVGDHAGNVIVLRLTGDTAQLVSKLSAHTGPISSLAWNRVKEVLFSGSYDNLVIMWDIGGKRGEAYELNGHSSKITRLCVAPGAARLFSADDAGKLVCWDMSANRLETPAWQTSDQCQLCESPFFWNISAMWQRKVVGMRQHHCRTCGKAVCGSCCDHWTVFPRMGYELPVRICNICHEKMEANPQPFDLMLSCEHHRPFILLGIFASFISLLLIVYLHFPDLDEADKKHLKYPRSLDDAKELGRILSHYKEQHFGVVFAGVVVVYLMLQSFAIPGSIFLTILSGYLFPFAAALLLVCTCSASGAVVCYFLSYLFGRSVVMHHFPERLNQWQEEVGKHRDNLLNYIVFLRVTPLLPNWFINIASPVLDVPVGPFFWGTFIGVAPPSFLYIQAGSTLEQMTHTNIAWNWNSIALLTFFAILSVLPVFWKRVVRDKLE